MREAFNYQKNNNHRRGHNGKSSGHVMEVKAILKKDAPGVGVKSDEKVPHTTVLPAAAQKVSLVTEKATTQVKSTHRKPEWIQKSEEPVETGKPILYLSIDVETDGPIPGMYSMLSLGLAGFTLDNQLVWEREINFLPLEGAGTYHKTMEWWSQPEQKEAWEHLMRNRQSPHEAMIRLSLELQKLKMQYRVFTIAWPACFDWMFLHWYMHRFVGENPLGRSAKCAGTYAWAISRTIHPNISIDTLLDSWEDDRFQHSHKALDDAKEQGAKFINMLNEVTSHGKDHRLNHHYKKVHVKKVSGKK